MEHTICKGNLKQVLQPKYIELLVFITQHYPNPVTREQIIETVWDGNIYVGDKALNNAIWNLRKAFSTLAPDTVFIETLRKTGYRLMVEPKCITVKNDYSKLKKYTVLKLKPYIILLLLGVFSLCIFLFSTLTDNQHKLNFSQSKSITQYPGRKLFPSIYPDERYVTFSWRQLDNKADLFLKDLHQPEVPIRNLTFSDYSESRSVWSPDSSAIYYARTHDEHGCEIVSKNLQNSKIDVIAQCHKTRRSALDISNDVQWLVFSGIDKNNKRSGIYLKKRGVNEVGQRITCLNNCNYTDESAAFSPDGKKLILSRSMPSGNEYLVVHNIVQGAEKRLTPTYLEIRGVDWHSIDNKIVFAVIQYGERLGFELDLDTEKLTQFPESGVSFPQYSKNNAVFYHNWEIDTAIMRIDIGSKIASSPFPLLQSDFNLRYPNYSSQTKKLAIVSNESGYDEIWISSLDGVNKKQLTNLKQTIKHPVWSHSGNKIAFSVNIGERDELYIIDVKTQNILPLDTGLIFHKKPSWSQDDQSIYVSNNKKLFKINIANKKITTLFGATNSYAIEPSAKELIYSKSGNQALWRYTYETEVTEPFPVKLNLKANTGWVYTNKGIYYFNAQGNDYQLKFYDFSTQRKSVVVRMPAISFNPSYGITFIPERNWVLFTGYENAHVNIKKITLNTP